VPVAYEVAAALEAPLDIFVVKKLGVPGHEELAMGAIASGRVGVINRDVVQAAGLSDAEVSAAAAKVERELERQEGSLRGGGSPPAVGERTVILVDDGLATGATARAAVEALRRLGAERIVVAVPVAAPEVCAALERDVDEVVCAHTPRPFSAVGSWYERFDQVSEDQVRELLREARERVSSSAAPSAPPG
jgi:predicted phosphoribosyltransferase